MSESEAPPLAQTAASPPVILHGTFLYQLLCGNDEPTQGTVLCVAFHHRNGPQVEFAYPPFPDQEHKRSQTTGTIDAAKPAIELPEEWSFMVPLRRAFLVLAWTKIISIALHVSSRWSAFLWRGIYMYVWIL